jgi:glycine/D-amino acid oxidase-like deaminating enzyme
MKGYSTKYALTQGIEAVTVEPGDGDARYVYTASKRLRNRNQYIVGKTFFESRDEAVTHAKQQAARKARALRKQLAKIDALAETPIWAKPTS